MKKPLILHLVFLYLYGKLYYRQDDTLVDGFLYAENQ